MEEDGEEACVTVCVRARVCVMPNTFKACPNGEVQHPMILDRISEPQVPRSVAPTG